MNEWITITYRPNKGEMGQTNYTTGTLMHPHIDPLDKETAVDQSTQVSSLWAWQLSSGSTPVFAVYKYQCENTRSILAIKS